MSDYQALLYPDRAENLSRQDVFQNYRVFLNHWDNLSEQVRIAYEAAHSRNQSQILLVHGEQGAGKSLFVNRLFSDFEAEKRTPNPITVNNLWHRITSGIWKEKSLVENATIQTSITKFDSQGDWLKNYRETHPEKSRVNILLIDNAERTFFLQGLLGLTAAEVLNHAKNPIAYKQAAENLVHLCRTEFQGLVVIILLNNREIASHLNTEIQLLHRQILKYVEFPFPPSNDKERVIRTNINLLNRNSYWNCLDKAGPEYKKDVYDSINGSKTYPDCFQSINEAWARVAKDRLGRGANKNIISLVLLCNIEESAIHDFQLNGIGVVGQDLKYKFFRSVIFKDGWTTSIIEDGRSASLVSSEWTFRIIFLGDPFVSCLRDSQNQKSLLKAFLEKVTEFLGIGTWRTTRETYEKELFQIIDSFPVQSYGLNQEFWNKDQARSNEYESHLRTVFPDYNTKRLNTLSYRPDRVVSDFEPCTILNGAPNNIDAINRSIACRGNILEFTAQKSASIETIKSYLKAKIENYVDIMYQ